MKFHPGDSVLSYRFTDHSKDRISKQWKVPTQTEILPLLKSFYEITGSDWHDCYGDYQCSIEGHIRYQGKDYKYDLNAAGWIILYNKTEQRYFGCKSPDCRHYFPVDCFCNEKGLIEP